MEKKTNSQFISSENVKKQMEKEALFVNTTEINEDIINKFYRFYKMKIKRFDFYSFLICGIIFIIVGIMNIFKGNEFLFSTIVNIIINLILIAIGITFWVSAFQTQKYDKKSMMKIYSEDISKLINYYYFYDDKVIIINKYGETERVFEYLENIYESKYYYYIFINRKKVHIMRKDSFTKGEEEEFHDFIKEKMKKHYKKRCIRVKKQKKEEK